MWQTKENAIRNWQIKGNVILNLSMTDQKKKKIYLKFKCDRSRRMLFELKYDRLNGMLFLI